MATQPLVSVIMPIYNASAFLRPAIESVLAQSYPHWELLLVDDGSTDGSPDFAREYAAKYGDTNKYLEHEQHQNRGKSSTRNLGIRHAQGEYLTFLDADDCFLPDKLTRQVKLLDAQPEVGMVYGRTLYWVHWAGAPASRQRDTLSQLKVRAKTRYAPPLLMTKFLRDTGSVPCICSLLVRREVVLAVGMFDERIQHLYEDQVLLSKLVLATPVWVEDGVGELYRQHPGSSSSQAQRSGEYDPWRPDQARLRYLVWLEGYLTAQGVHDARVYSALRKAFFPYRYPLFTIVRLPAQRLVTAVSNMASAALVGTLRRVGLR